MLLAIIFSFRRSLARSFAPSKIFLLKTPPRIFFFYVCLSVCHMLNLVYLAYIHVCPSVTHNYLSCLSCLSVCHILNLVYLA